MKKSITELKNEQIDEFVEETIKNLTLEEKIKLLSGGFTREEMFKHSVDIIDGETKLHYNKIPYPSGKLEKYDFAPVKFVDGPRGVVCGNSTCFPVPMARGASFDPDLEEKVGDAIAKELRAQGGNYFGGVCINILRHPAVGRAQETYGEDMYLLGEMGASLVRGVQKHNVMACVKHFACNNIENTRFKVNVELSDRTLHEVYLPHFKRCVDEGAASIMGAYNRVRGDYCCESKLLLTDILREKWGFEGFVLSDFMRGVYDAAKAINAGCEIEMPIQLHYVNNLELDVKEGVVSEAVIDESVRRVLKTSLKFEIAEDPMVYDMNMVCCEEHKNLAREVAEKSIVLLKNESSILPINSEKISKVTMLGQLANVENVGDQGSSRVIPPKIITPFEGLKDYLDGSGVVIESCFDNKDIDSAKKVSKDADVVIIIAGCTYSDEGEYLTDTTVGVAEEYGLSRGGDRKSIRLKEDEIKLIKEVAKVNKNIVLVTIGGSAFIYEDILDDVSGLLMAWYPGMEGGKAISNVLFGEVNPSGKIPFTIPKSEEDLARFDSEVHEINYEYYHGYMLTDKENREPRYPFGYGLSYTTFEFSNLQADVNNDQQLIKVSVDLENTGKTQGEEVVQVYLGFNNSKIDRPKKLLKGFNKLKLEPGEKNTVKLSIPVSELMYYSMEKEDFVLEEECLIYDIFVGNSADDKNLLKTEITLNKNY